MEPNANRDRASVRDARKENGLEIGFLFGLKWGFYLDAPSSVSPQLDLLAFQSSTERGEGAWA